MTDPPEWLAIPRPDEIYHEPVHDGPCSCDVLHPAASQEIVYTLHFDPPYEPYPGAPAYKCAGHYTGRALERRLPERLAEHEQGRGARITQVQREAGGTWRLASVEPGGADRERQLKQHSAARRCPICETEAEQATAARWQEATSPQSEPQIYPELKAELGPEPEPEAG
jgi:predicted GIY-YIG superfamily endonuclease